MIDRLKSTYHLLCWLPLVFYIVADKYVSTVDGWGQWALGAVVLPTILLSVGFFIAGIWITVVSYKKSQPVGRLLFATLLSGSVFLGFGCRLILLDLL